MRGFAVIGLDNPKNPLNVGSVLRAAGCYGAALVAVSGLRAARHVRRSPTDTHKSFRHIPVIRCESLREIIPFDTVPVAIEIIDGARDLRTYVHPERAFYIFGQEDGTLGRRVFDWCRDVVCIPTRQCMNLAATVNVVLYDRMVKNGGD
jgi:tRNA(Leu) C34 or U34 (ribose-2'-O)-methylase TrmL